MLNKIRFGIYRTKYVHGPLLPLRKPVDVSLELSSSCNMKCGYCYHADKANLPFKQGLMSMETAKRIVESAADCGVHSLKFNYRGESTLNPIFFPITKLAKSLARGSTFLERLTNSNFKFDTEREEIFQGLCNQTKVKISYDSFDKAVFEGQRLGGDHDVTTRNIDKFYNYRFRRETEIVIQAVRTTKNKDEDIAGLAKKRWPEATISIRDMVAGRVDKDLSALENKEREGERQSCTQAHVRLMFDWLGRAGVCCPDIGNEIVAGDIYKNSVREIFNSQVARQVRRDLLSGKAFESSPCKNCSSFESFKGFRPSWTS